MFAWAQAGLAGGLGVNLQLQVRIQRGLGSWPLAPPCWLPTPSTRLLATPCPVDGHVLLEKAQLLAGARGGTPVAWPPGGSAPGLAAWT